MSNAERVYRFVCAKRAQKLCVFSYIHYTHTHTHTLDYLIQSDFKMYIMNCSVHG